MANPQSGPPSSTGCRSHLSRARKALTRILPGCLVPPPPPPPLPSWMVLEEHVGTGDPPDRLQQEWTRIKCSTARAYGCGEHGQKLLDGLSLYIRLVKPLRVSTALYVHLSDEALRGLRAEFGEGDGPPISIDDGELRATASVSATNDEVLVLAVVFRLHGFHLRIYYIVYDAIDGSMTMLLAPSDPCCLIGGMPKPLPVLLDRGDGSAAGDELVFMAQKLVPRRPGQRYNTYEDVLYRWTRGAKSEGNGGLWHVQRRRLPNGVEHFVVEAMFAMNDKVFFADLAQVLVCCDLPAADGSDVNFDFIPLPAEAPADPRWVKNEPEHMGPMNWYRTMSCAGGFIRFVCINRSAVRPVDMKLAQFTLDLPNKKWVMNMELRAVELWKCLGLHRRGLPETVPKCPLLMSDNTLSLLLPSMRMTKEDPSEDYVYNFSMKGKKVNFHWSARLDDCRYSEPIILSWDFFLATDPPNNVMPRRTIFL